MADSGIYQILNVVNGKRYIGSAVNFTKRWHEHRRDLNAKRHANGRLQASWCKYGADAFAFSVIEECEPALLIGREQSAIDRLDPEYNICRKAGSTLGMRYTEESRQRMSEARRGCKKRPYTAERRDNISKALKGKAKSEVHMNALQAGRRARVYTEEQGLATSDSLKAAYAEGRKSRERPQEYRDKIAASLRGRVQTDEHRKAVSIAMTGKKRGPYNITREGREGLRENARKTAAARSAKRLGQPPPS